MCRRALAGYEKNFLSKTIPALHVIRNLGLLFRDQGKAEEARAMFERALLGRQEVLGPNHSHTLQVASLLEKLRLEQEERRKEVQNINAGHKSTAERKKYRWKHFLPLRSSKTTVILILEENSVEVRSEIASCGLMPT